MSPQPTAYLSTASNTPTAYHTDTACPHFPTDTEPADRDWLERTSIRHCRWCKWHGNHQPAIADGGEHRGD